MASVREGRVKVIIPLTDIQLLHPVTATMLGKGQGRGWEGEVRRKERMDDGEWKKKTNRQEGETHVNDCKVKQRERREGKGRRKAENMVEGSEIVLLTLQEEAVREGGRREGQERGRRDGGKRKEGAICISVSTW